MTWTPIRVAIMETWVWLNLQLSPRIVPMKFVEGGNSGRTNEGVVAGIFSARMIPKASSESHAVRCVYHPKARNPDWDSDTNPNSNPQSIVGGPPQAPSSFTIQPGDRAATLSWTTSNSENIKAYQYQYKPDGGNFNGWEDIADSAPGEDHEDSYNVENLINDTEYTFQLRAVNDDGLGSFSEAKATPQATLTGPYPPALNAHPGDGRVTLNWEPPNDDGGSSITEYQYNQQIFGGTPGGWTSIPSSAVGESNEKSYIVDPLANETEYTFQIRAVNDVDVGVPSNPIDVTPTAADTEPSPPKNLRIVTVGDAQVSFEWDLPDSDGGSDITDYQYQKIETSGGTWGAWTNIPNDIGGSLPTSYIVSTGLNNGTEYSFQIRAINNVGESLASNPITARPQAPAQVPLVPIDFNAEAEDAQVLLSWKKPDNRRSPIEKYQYIKKVESAAWETSWADIPSSGEGETNDTSYTVSSLSNGTAYRFKLRAKNGVGYGAVTSETDEVNPSSTADVPTIPLNLRAEAGNAQVDLDWEGSSDRGSAITGYQYRKKGRSENWGSTHTWVDIPDSAPPSGNNKISYSITTGLTNGTEYSFQVRAKTAREKVILPIR